VPTHIAMSSSASLALMKFLSDLAKRLGVGRHVYVVGGAVRNFVIRRPIKDIDVVIDSVALRGKDSDWFAKEVAKAIPAKTRIQTNDYGVALLHIVGDWMLGEENLQGEDIEIANARIESYTDGGYKPTHVEKATIEDDARRREFTFNCMAGDTLIPTEKGILRIDQIASRDGGDHQDIRLTVAGQDGPSTAVGWQYSGYAPTLRVTTEWGHSFSCTPHHPVLVLRGHDHEWVQADQLEEGDLLCVPVRQVARRTPLALDLPDPVQPKRGRLKDVRKPERMTPELAFLIGCIVAEGSNTHKRVSFSNSDPALISHYVECFHATFGFQPSRNKVVEKGSVRILRGVEFVASADGYDIYADSKAVVGWLEDLGLYCGGSKDGKSASHHKIVPWSILQADERSQWAFLAAYLEGDGSIRPETGRITYCSASPHVRQQLQVLLGAHGILSKVKGRFVYINAVDSALLWEKIQPWMVTKGFDYTRRDNKARNRYGIPAEYIRGFLAGRKQDTSRAVYATDGDGFRTLPDVHEPVRKVQRLLHDAHARGGFDGFLASLKAISPDEFAKLQRLFDLGYQYVEVTSVEDAGQQDVFDISMGEGVEPAFVANGVVVHNTLMWRLQDLANGPDKAEIIDLTGCGLADLAAGSMKCPSSPDKTFTDDATRMVRAIKFIVKYGFKLTPDTEAAIRRHKGKLKNIKPGHLSTMLVDLLREPTAKKALEEMQRLGLLDEIKDIAQSNGAMANALFNVADETRSDALFAMMDMGLPSGKRLGFLDRYQVARLREIAVDLSFDATDQFIAALKQPGKVLDMRSLIKEFGLRGQQIAQVTDLARRHLLDSPSLVTDKRRLTQRVRLDLQGGRTAAMAPTWFPDEGDQVTSIEAGDGWAYIGFDSGQEVGLPTDERRSQGWKAARTAAVKGSGAKVGLMLPLPEELAAKFPSLGDEDDSPPHCTLLYVGDVRGREAEFLAAVQAEASQYRPMRATIQPLDYFEHPEKERRVAYCPVRFDGYMDQLRDGIRVRLTDAGFALKDRSLLIYNPHITLAYLDGLDSKYEGQVPTGSWTVEGLAVWGMAKPETYPLSRTAKKFELEIGDPLFTGKYLNSPGRIEGFGENEKGDPTVIVRKRPKKDQGGQGAKKEVKLFKVRYDKDQAARDKAEKSAREFGTDEARKEYLREHPGADPKNHTVTDDAPEAEDDKPKRGKLRSAVSGAAAIAKKVIKRKVERGKDVASGVAKLLKGDVPDPKERARIARLLIREVMKGGINAAMYVAIPPPPGYIFAKKVVAEATKLLDKKLEARFGVSKVGGELTEDALAQMVQDSLNEAVDAVGQSKEANAAIRRLCDRYNQATMHRVVLEVGADDITKSVPIDSLALLFNRQFADAVQASGEEETIVPLHLLAETQPSPVDSTMPLYGQGRPALPRGEAGEVEIHRMLVDRVASRYAQRFGPNTPLMEHEGNKVKYRVKSDSDAILAGVYYGRARIGGLHASVMRYPERETCGRDVLKLLAKYPQVEDTSRPRWVASDGEERTNTRALQVYKAFITDESKQGLGIGKAMYLAVMVEWFKKVGPFLFMPYECSGGSGTSTAAGRVWKSLARDFPSSGNVIAVLRAPTLPGGLKTAAKGTKKKVKNQKGEQVTVYEYSEGQVQHRNREKAKKVEKLRQNLDKLRGQIGKDLKSKDEKTRLCALAVGLMNDTYERVGNPGSAKDGHFGVTGWQAKHVTLSGGKATIKYVGKSGVSQTKTTSDSGLVSGLREALKGKSGTDPVFEGVEAGDVNAYLKPHGITAKDIRGLHANREVQTRLKAIRGKGGKLPTDKKEREQKLKKEFQQALDEAAKEVGHEASTLRSQYLVPGLEDTFMRDGTVKEKLDKQGRLSWGLRQILGRADEIVAVFGWGESEMTSVNEDPEKDLGGGLIGYVWRTGRQWYSMAKGSMQSEKRRNRAHGVYGLRHPMRLAADKVAIISIYNAWPEEVGYTSPDPLVSLVGFEGLISSLTAYEWALINDMDRAAGGAEHILVADDGTFTWRGYPVMPDVVTELQGAGYLGNAEDGKIGLSWQLIGKRQLYKQATRRLAARWFVEGASPRLVWRAPRGSDPWKLAQKAGINILSHMDFVAGYEAGGKLVAALFDSSDSGDQECYAFDIVVDPDGWQRRGLGGKLMDIAISQYDDLVEPFPDIQFCLDAVNPHAVRMLKQRGFVETGREQGHTLMTRRATKSKAEKEEEEVERLNRRNPTKKPPRRDLRRNRMKEDDPDIEGFGADGDRDLSNNYKKRATLAANRVALRWLMAEGEPSQKRKPGDVWPSDDGTWNAMNAKGQVRNDFGKDKDSKAKAEAYAKGDADSPEEAEEAVAEKAKEDEAKKKEQAKADKEKFTAEITDLAEKLYGDKVITEETALLLMEKADSAEFHAAYKAEMKQLRELFDDFGVTVSAMKDIAKDPFKGVDGDDIDELAEAVVQAKAQEALLLDPTNVGGQPLSSEQLDDDARTERAMQAMKLYRRVSPDQRRQVAEDAAAKLGDFEKGSPEHDELNAIIDGIHAAAVLNDEDFDAKHPDGRLVREPLNSKLKLVLKQMVKQGNAEVLFLKDSSKVYAAEGRAAVRDAMGKLDDEGLAAISEGTSWEPLVKALADNPDMAPEVQEYLRAMIRDMGVMHMTTVQGVAAAITRKKRDPANLPELFDQTADEVEDKTREAVDSAVDEALQACLEEGKTQAECMKRSREAVVRAQAEATADAIDDMDVEPDAQDTAVAVLRAVAGGADLSLLDDPSVRPERSPEERKRDFLENVKDPAERKRIEQMSPDEFTAMEKAVLSEDEQDLVA